MEDNIHWIALHLVEGIGITRFRKLVEYFGSPEKVFAAERSDLLHVEGINSKIASSIRMFSIEKKLENELRLIAKHSVKVITINDESYPPSLKYIHDPPQILYVKGTLTKEDVMAIAVVGTRHATEYGADVSDRLSRKLVQNNITVVSGLARGIDTCAHKAALAEKGRTIAVLGNGISVAYPRENRLLMDLIPSSGALISEYSMSEGPQAHNFPMRNRIISGLSLGTVVIEAAIRSGALITAECALEEGREVFAVPGNIFSKYSQGSHSLIKQGAKLLESFDDIIDEIPILKEKLNKG